MAESANNQVAHESTDGTAYLREMCARHARLDGRKVVIDLSEQQINALGHFLLQAVFGWFLGLPGTQPSNGARAAVVSTKDNEEENRSLS